MGGTLFGQADAAPPVLVQVMPLVLIGAVIYLLLFRPEQQRRREHDRMVAALRRNDQIVMASGIHGRVTGLGDKTVTVEIAPKVQVIVDRTAVQAVERGAEKAPAAEVREKEREKS